MRFALIANQAFSVANFRGPLLRALVDRGVEVLVLAPDYDAASRAAVRALGAEPVDYSMSRAGMNPLRDGLDMLRLVALLRRLRPDMTLGYFIKPVIYGTLAAWLAGVPRRFAMIEGAGYVFVDGERASRRRGLLRRAVSSLYALALHRAERVFMLNSDDHALFVGRGMVDADKVELLDGIGLDLEHFRPAPPVTSPPTFILVARLLREKGVREYVEAARRVRLAVPDARFLLIGSGDLNPGSIAEAEVAAWVAEGLVECPGHVADVRGWLAQASVFVLPSWREGLPRSTQEAMALARPVITTDAPGCRETVEPGVNGVLVPVRDVDALAAAMLEFVRDPAKIARMGAASRAIAERRFDVRRINARILECLGLGEGGTGQQPSPRPLPRRGRG